MGVLFITADQISKSLIKSTMALYDVIPVIPGYFYLTYIINEGMAFGIDLPFGIGTLFFFWSFPNYNLFPCLDLMV